jgi:flagellar basal-body rod modification protein FlgD
MAALSSATAKPATSVSARSATSTTGTGSSSTSTTGAAAGMGKDDFMQLLVAQLKNQDPMKPMDDKEFVTQLAQFSSLEASQKMTETIEALSASEMIVQAATLIGKQATAKLETGETVTGTISQVKIQDGKPIAVINGTDVDTSLITQIGN